ncbi:unknown [Ruminococcus sp. CAG:382]|nr:unknown [Ruminococcus sp. CAG:382]
MMTICFSDVAAASTNSKSFSARILRVLSLRNVSSMISAPAGVAKKPPDLQSAVFSFSFSMADMYESFQNGVARNLPYSSRSISSRRFIFLSPPNESARRTISPSSRSNASSSTSVRHSASKGFVSPSSAIRRRGESPSCSKFSRTKR